MLLGHGTMRKVCGAYIGMTRQEATEQEYNLAKSAQAMQLQNILTHPMRGIGAGHCRLIQTVRGIHFYRQAISRCCNLRGARACRNTELCFSFSTASIRPLLGLRCLP